MMWWQSLFRTRDKHGRTKATVLAQVAVDLETGELVVIDGERLIWVGVKLVALTPHDGGDVKE